MKKTWYTQEGRIGRELVMELSQGDTIIRGFYELTNNNLQAGIEMLETQSAYAEEYFPTAS